MGKRLSISKEKRDKITKELSLNLKDRKEIVFSYFHGSFLKDTPFSDVDVAVFIDEKIKKEDYLSVEIDIEQGLNNIIKKYPVEVRVLNSAPLSFRYGVIKEGDLIFTKDEELADDFVERTLDLYFDFAPFREEYLKEVFSFGTQS